MKKLTLICLAILSFGSVFAQKAKVNSAKNYLNYDEYDKAIQNINEAIQDPTTAMMPKAWYYRGLIYLTINQKKQDSVMHISGALDTALNSFRRSLALNAEEFGADMMPYLGQLSVQYKNDGILAYNAKEYKTAYHALNNSTQTDGLIRSINKEAPLDTTMLFYAAQAAYMAEMNKEAAIAFEACTKVKYKDAYKLLSYTYLSMGDTVKAINVMNEAVSSFPDDYSMLIAKKDMLLRAKRYADAISTIQALIDKEPKNGELLMILGSIYEYQGESEKARETFVKALAINPDDYDVNEMMGTSLYNKAVICNNKMLENRDPSKEKIYNEFEAKRNAAFKEALPYLVKADSIKPGQADLIKMIKKIKAVTGQ
jgi:tetratricopeptide (TPR) repeat protein